ncbi:OmpG family monomeric porin [Providencia sp. PROV223]|uniref:OmpG family monomeric porin n=1 Tax=Providencia sp. PROV223 TaxID=2949917 RepID=UPI00234BB3DA|nr:OmpG family monomeric porin [Providencia sp. PROV223]
MKTSLNGLLFVTLTGLATSVFAADQVNNDYWRVSSTVYMELEKFEGHHNTSGRKVYDKTTMVGQLFLVNPESKWSFFLEHKESLRSYNHNFSTSKDSFIRNRTQIGATRKMYASEIGQFNLNVTYRKESNDSAPGTQARPSNTMFWLMPSGTYNFNDKWAFNFWDAVYHYDNFHAPNSYEWESEHGLVYKVNDSATAKVYLYTDWTWDKDFNKTWEQNQIRGYFPITLNQDWSVMPYFRYYLNEHNYDSNKRTTQKVKDGYRVGTQVFYNLTPKLTLWGGFAVEPSTWENPKNAGITSGGNNRQTFYLGQLGVKYQWQ